MAASSSIPSPFRLGVLAAFSGHAPDPGSRRFQLVDRDELDPVLAAIRPRVELGLPFCAELGFGCGEDFHPDQIARRVPALAKLLQARAALDRPERMRELIGESGLAPAAETAGAERGSVGPSEADAPEGDRSSGESGTLDEGELLEDLLARPRPQGEVTRTARLGDPTLQRLIEEIAEESADRTDYAAQDRWRSALDAELSRCMRQILHHPSLRALEASWQSLRGLVRACDPDEGLRIEIVDLDPPALLDRGAALHELIYEQAAGTPGADAFSLLVVDRIIEAQDRELLRAIARVAHAARVPVLLGAGASLCTPPSVESEEWAELRASPEAAWVGVCLPRILLRLPYGSETEPIDTFSFEEAEGGGEPSSYLWGNAAYLVARVISRCMQETGSLAAIGRYAELDSLPFHVFRTGGETQPRHPTEILLSEADLKQRIQDGFIPLAGFLGRDIAVLTSLRSLAGTPLLEGAA